jgi:hypothetical protein
MNRSKLLLALFLTPILRLCIMQSAFAQTENLGSVKYTPPMPAAKGVRRFWHFVVQIFFIASGGFRLAFNHRLLSVGPPG